MKHAHVTGASGGGPHAVALGEAVGTCCRLASVKQAADAAGRKICFIGMSLTTYLEAAHREGRAPFDPNELVDQSDMDSVDPNKLLVVTTGSQVADKPSF